MYETCANYNINISIRAADLIEPGRVVKLWGKEWIERFVQDSGGVDIRAFNNSNELDITVRPGWGPLTASLKALASVMPGVCVFFQ